MKLPTAMNLGTGKESTRPVAFSHGGWHEETTNYHASVKGLSDEDMDKIVTLAKEFCHASTREANESGAGGSIDVDDDRANIVEGSGSSEPSDQDDAMACDEDLDGAESD